VSPEIGGKKIPDNGWELNPRHQQPTAYVKTTNANLWFYIVIRPYNVPSLLSEGPTLNCNDYIDKNLNIDVIL
jgi:hypothetical protein